MEAKGGGQEWYYHAPSPRKTAEKQPVPPASQIPGLAALDAQDVEAMQRETGTNKLNWIRDTDSKYIQLAKKGGRKDLLTFNAQNSKSDGPQPYPRVDWFEHVPMSTEEEKKILAQRKWNPPEYMVHEPYIEQTEKPTEPVKIDLGAAIKERRNIQEKYESRSAPYHTDNKSMWKRVIDESDVSQPALHVSGDDLKLPRIPNTEKAGLKNETNFSKLMSGGYGSDWIKQHSNKASSKRARGLPRKPWTHFTEYQEAISKKEPPKQRLKPIVYPQRKVQEIEKKKVPFKIRKFSNVKPKLFTGAVHS